jgi:aldehyde:ferredoxin oxidoreductase
MKKMIGMSKKVLEVDLTATSFKIYTVPDADIQMYLGGKGLGLKLIYDRITPGTVFQEKTIHCLSDFLGKAESVIQRKQRCRWIKCWTNITKQEVMIKMGYQPQKPCKNLIFHVDKTEVCHDGIRRRCLQGPGKRSGRFIKR